MHLGREGIESTNGLVSSARRYEPGCVLREGLYRVALTEANAAQHKETSVSYPEWATWLNSEDIASSCATGGSLGGLHLSGGCKVVHVPTYLRGLWKACEEMAAAAGGAATWSAVKGAESTKMHWSDRLEGFDAVVLAAGAGMFQDTNLLADAIGRGFPSDLVRGQSVEVSLSQEASGEPSTFQMPFEAVLCGKYIAPTPDNQTVLVGATHEYKAEPLSGVDVAEELRQKAYNLAPNVWDLGKVVKTTSGYRVQSRRGKYGRTPIIGQWETENFLHNNMWLFTGLSSRGLIYHGIYGEFLSDAIMNGDEGPILEMHPHLSWWRDCL